MDFRRDDLKRTARAPAKLNLFLNLLGRREDGFHEVETVMVPIRIADTVSFVPATHDECSVPGEVSLKVQTVALPHAQQGDASIPTGSENLVVRALKLLQERSGCSEGARVELVKRIPAAAGLGGGSSDAAAALRLANHGWGIHWSNERLAEVAAELGSDVPFFLAPGAAVCRGRGERVSRLPPLAPLHVVVVKPPVGLSTADVYRAYAERSAQSKQLDGNRVEEVQLAEFVNTLAGNCMRGLGEKMRNSLQQAASALSPWIAKVQTAFDRLDFVGHQLSGSGSAYFGICRHARHARRLANMLRTWQLGLVYATRSCQ